MIGKYKLIYLSPDITETTKKDTRFFNFCWNKLAEMGYPVFIELPLLPTVCCMVLPLFCHPMFDIFNP